MNVNHDHFLAPWVATVPQHWCVNRIGSVADVVFSNVDKHALEGEVPVRLCNYTDVYKNDRITSVIEFMQASALPREIEKFQIRSGDVLATKDSEDPNDIAVSALIAEDLPGVLCGYHLAMIRPLKEKMCGSYLAWVQASKPILSQYEARAVGVTRFGLSQAAFKEALVPVPPLAEQRRIAGYLDEATGKIDRLLGLRWRQMELLQEQRAALIQQAVTRGLNPNAPLKPSGLQWQPEIPTSWIVLQVRRLISFITSGSRGWAEFYSDEGEVFVQSGNLTRSMTVDLSDAQRVTPPAGAEVERTRLARHDVLVCVTGALTGNVAIVDFDPPTAFVNQHVALLRPRPKLIEPKFLSFSLWAFTGQTQFKLAEYGGTKQGLSLDDVRLAFVAVPPVDEQRRILAFIEIETAKLDALQSRYARQLELLSEYRAALIHECVTGQRRMETKE